MKSYDNLTITEIKADIIEFIKGRDNNKGRHPAERYASFDYCFNYFQSFYENHHLRELVSTKNIQTSCLQLSFYLASWGMLRGSSFLLEKSAKYFEKLIHTIVELDKTVWEIDVDKYNNDSNVALMICYDNLRKALGKRYNPSVALVTKIMLGVFGNTPALDSRFSKCFKVYSFSDKTLKRIERFYSKHKGIIDRYSKIRTFDFHTGDETKRQYTKAKIIDMIGFIEGGKK